MKGGPRASFIYAILKNKKSSKAKAYHCPGNILYLSINPGRGIENALGENGSSGIKASRKGFVCAAAD
jgi:hypothetical protein